MNLHIIKDLFAVLALFGILFVVASLDMWATIGDYGYHFAIEEMSQ